MPASYSCDEHVAWLEHKTRSDAAWVGGVNRLSRLQYEGVCTDGQINAPALGRNGAQNVLCSATHLCHRLVSVLLCERDAEKVNTPLTAACSRNNQGGAGAKVETMNLSFLFYARSALPAPHFTVKPTSSSPREGAAVERRQRAIAT